MRFQLLLTNLVLFLFMTSCNQQLQNEQKDEVSIAQPIRLELNLSGNSRSSRFLGTYDEIDRLTLDLNRVYGNRKVVTGMELNKDNQTSMDRFSWQTDYRVWLHNHRTCLQNIWQWNERWNFQGRDFAHSWWRSEYHIIEDVSAFRWSESLGTEDHSNGKTVSNEHGRFRQHYNFRGHSFWGW